ncbi:hypothetical protein C8J57DRAFT_1498656 [Mycena rebaudengoi]|nr:hypothetical protein C8J57DRAFT_1498656 [Mycena rebaudengoi]
MLNLAVALTFFSSIASAQPIRPIHSSGGLSLAACLAVLATLFCTLILLVLFKYVYIRKRRVGITPQTSVLSLPVPSTSALASEDSITSYSENLKAGFIVGFFGSPSVEIQCALEKAEWKENKESSFTYHIHTESRRRKMDYPSVLDISRERNGSVSSSPRTLYNSLSPARTRSFRLPSLPDKAHVASSKPLQPRRFSLPAMSRTKPKIDRFCFNQPFLEDRRNFYHSRRTPFPSVTRFATNVPHQFCIELVQPQVEL